MKFSKLFVLLMFLMFSDIFAVSLPYYRNVILVNSGAALGIYRDSVHLTASNFDFSHAKKNGEDIRFTKKDGTTPLSYWIEKWDSANADARIWVKTDTLLASATDTVRIYYGNSSATSLSDGYSTFPVFLDGNGPLGAAGPCGLFGSNEQMTVRRGVVYASSEQDSFPSVRSFFLDSNFSKDSVYYAFRNNYGCTPIVDTLNNGTWVIIEYEKMASWTYNRVRCLNLYTGAEVWRSDSSLGFSQTSGMNQYTMDNGTRIVIVPTANGIWAFDINDGDSIWTYRKAELFNKTPAVDQANKWIWSARSSGYSFYLSKINAETGVSINECNPPYNSSQNQVGNVVLVNDAYGYFVTTSVYGTAAGEMWVIDSNCTTVWWDTTNLILGEKNVLAYKDGKLITGHGDGWTTPVGGNQVGDSSKWKCITAYNIATGTKAWTCDLSVNKGWTDSQFVEDVAICKNRVYANTDDGTPQYNKHVYVINLTTGALIENFDCQSVGASCGVAAITNGYLLKADVDTMQGRIRPFKIASSGKKNDWWAYGTYQTNQMCAPDSAVGTELDSIQEYIPNPNLVMAGWGLGNGAPRFMYSKTVTFRGHKFSLASRFINEEGHLFINQTTPQGAEASIRIRMVNGGHAGSHGGILLGRTDAAYAPSWWVYNAYYTTSQLTHYRAGSSYYDYGAQTITNPGGTQWCKYTFNKLGSVATGKAYDSNFASLGTASTFDNAVVSPEGISGIMVYDTGVYFDDFFVRNFRTGEPVVTVGAEQNSVLRLDSIRPIKVSWSDTVKVYGFYFGDAQGSSTILIGDSTPVVTSWTDGLLKFLCPRLPTGDYDFIASDGVTNDTILDATNVLGRMWTLPIKVRIKPFNTKACVVDPIFSARVDSTRQLFKGFVSSAAIHAKSWNVGHAAGDTARYTISAAQLNQCGTTGLWQFKFLASDLNITDSIYRYWPYGTNIDTSSVNELRLR